jgi:hypothetical protein
MDATWKAANALQTNWQSPSFNDSSWTNALVLGSYGISPWGTGTTVQTAPADLSEAVHGRLRLAAGRDLHLRPGSIRTIRQRHESGQCPAVSGLELVQPDLSLRHADLTSYLTNGNNAVGVMLGNGMYNVPPPRQIIPSSPARLAPRSDRADISLLHQRHQPGHSQRRMHNGSRRPAHYLFASLWRRSQRRPALPAGWNQAGFNASTGPRRWSPTGPAEFCADNPTRPRRLSPHKLCNPSRPMPFPAARLSMTWGRTPRLIPSLTTHGQAGAVVQITPPN